MENFIKELEISNFKSIRNIKMDCKRINVLIGKPNVGKSNVLEALSMLCDIHRSTNRNFLGDYIRYERIANLFYDNDKKNEITIKSDIGFASLKMNLDRNNTYSFFKSSYLSHLEWWGDVSGYSNTEIAIKELIDNFEKNAKALSHEVFFASIDNHSHYSYLNNVLSSGMPVKKYDFRRKSHYQSNFHAYLDHPYGDNLLVTLENNPVLWEECAAYFNQYGLDLLLDIEDSTIEVQKKMGRRVTKIPYSLAADTLQRFIFHLAAIESNKNSILLLEEPESHSFPPYISQLGNRIIDNKENQFFIATHSPYLLTSFIEECPPEEVAIFIARYENYETKIRVLNQDDINNILETGIDLFYNINAFEE